ESRPGVHVPMLSWRLDSLTRSDPVPMRSRQALPKPSRIAVGTVPHPQIESSPFSYRVKQLDLVRAGDVRENADSNLHSLGSFWDAPASTRYHDGGASRDCIRP